MSVSLKTPAVLSVFKLDLFSFVLVLLLTLRIFIDRSDLGGVIGALLVGLFGLFILVKHSLPSFMLPVVLTFGTLIIYAYLNAFYLYNEPLFSLRGVIRYFTYFTFFVMMYYSRISFRVFFSVFTFIVAVQSAIAVVQFFLFGMERPSGTFINSNHFSYFLIPYFSILLFVYQRYFVALLVFLMAAFLGGMGGIICLLLVLLVYFLQNSNHSQKKWAILIFPLFIVAAGFLMQDRISELEDLETLSDRIEGERMGGGSSLVWRIVTWDLMLDELVNKDGLQSGLGIEYASIVSPYFLQSSVREPHNDYLRVLLEVGVYGFIIFILALFFILKSMYISAKKYKSNLFYSIFSSLLALSSGMIVGNIIVLSTLWWLMLSIIAIAKRDEHLYLMQYNTQ